MKAEGLDYSTSAWRSWRALEPPKPLRDLRLCQTLQQLRRLLPLGEESIRPKSIAREMFEGFRSFSDYVREHHLERAEALLLRHLHGVYRLLSLLAQDRRRPRDGALPRRHAAPGRLEPPRGTGADGGTPVRPGSGDGRPGTTPPAARGATGRHAGHPDLHRGHRHALLCVPRAWSIGDDEAALALPRPPTPTASPGRRRACGPPARPTAPRWLAPAGSGSAQPAPHPRAPRTVALAVHRCSSTPRASTRPGGGVLRVDLPGSREAGEPLIQLMRLAAGLAAPSTRGRVPRRPRRGRRGCAWERGQDSRATSKGVAAGWPCPRPVPVEGPLRLPRRTGTRSWSAPASSAPGPRGTCASAGQRVLLLDASGPAQRARSSGGESRITRTDLRRRRRVHAHGVGLAHGLALAVVARGAAGPPRRSACCCSSAGASRTSTRASRCIERLKPAARPAGPRASSRSAGRRSLGRHRAGALRAGARRADGAAGGADAGRGARGRGRDYRLAADRAARGRRRRSTASARPRARRCAPTLRLRLRPLAAESLSVAARRSHLPHSPGSLLLRAARAATTRFQPGTCPAGRTSTTATSTTACPTSRRAASRSRTTGTAPPIDPDTGDRSPPRRARGRACVHGVRFPALARARGGIPRLPVREQLQWRLPDRPPSALAERAASSAPAPATASSTAPRSDATRPTC